LLDLEGSGIFFLVTSIVSISVTFTRFGFGQLLARKVAAWSAVEQWEEIGSFLSKALLIAFFSSAVIAAAFYFFGEAFALRLFEQPGLGSGLKALAPAIIPVALVAIVGQAFQGLHKANRMLFYRDAGVISFAALAIWIAYLWHLSHSPTSVFSVNSVIYGYLAACFLTFFIAVVDWYRVPKRRNSNISFSSISILTESFPFYLSSILMVVLQLSSQLLVGVWHPSAEVAEYAVALRLAGVLGLAFTAFNIVAAPRFSVAHAAGDRKQLVKDANLMNRYLALGSLPICALLLMFPEIFLSFFGEAYVESKSILRLLVVSQLMTTFAMSVGTVLDMTGHARSTLRAMTIATFLLIIASVLIVPSWAAEGAAWALLLARTVHLVMNLISLKKKLGFIPAF